MAHHSEGGSASVRSEGSKPGQGGRLPVERLAVLVERAGHCLAAGNQRSAARRLRRFWADYLSVVAPDAPEAADRASGGAGPDLAARARRAREAGAIGEELADAVAAVAASEAGDPAATARLLDLTTSHLDGRLG